MGARVVKLTCAYCQKPFKGEHKQAKAKTACCSYRCDRWKRHTESRQAALANWRYLPNTTRRNHERWITQ